MSSRRKTLWPKCCMLPTTGVGNWHKGDIQTSINIASDGPRYRDRSIVAVDKVGPIGMETVCKATVCGEGHLFSPDGRRGVRARQGLDQAAAAAKRAPNSAPGKAHERLGPAPARQAALQRVEQEQRARDAAQHYRPLLPLQPQERLHLGGRR